MNSLRGGIVFGMILGASVLAQEAVPAAGEERAEAAKSEAPSAFMELEPAVFTYGARAWERGNVESIGDLLLPVYSTRSGLIFLNPRTSFRGDESELNLGAGYRTLLGDRGMIMGVNGYYDRRYTDANNTFDQIGFGLEFLSTWLDARANYYLPEDDIEDASVIQAGTPYEYNTREVDWDKPYGRGNQALQDGVRTDSLIRANPYVKYVRQEQALEGFDCEVGVLLPIPVLKDWSDVKLFGGYYSFDNDLTHTIEGWKGRVEVHALPSLLLDAEMFEDADFNDGKFYLGARFQVPFDIGAWAAGKNPFAGAVAGFKPARRNAERPFDYRLTEMVMRDPRVQSEVEDVDTIQYTVNEVLQQNQTRIRDVLVDNLVYVDGDNGTGAEDGTFEHPYSTITEALEENPETIYVFDAGTAYRERLFIDKDGQTLIGSGTGLPAHGGYRFATGRYPVLVNPGRKSKDSVMPFAGTMNVMADNVSISGFEFRGDLMEELGGLLGGKTKLPSLPEMDIDEILDILRIGASYSGLIAFDANNLVVENNVFSGNAVGLLALYGPVGDLKTEPLDKHQEHVLVVAHNRFENNLIGMLTAGVDPYAFKYIPDPVPLTVGITDNAFTDNLLGLGVVEIGGGLTALMMGNSFDNSLPTGIGGLLVNVGNHMNAYMLDNTLQGNHAIGFGLFQEEGDMDAVIANNTIRDCQLSSLLVEANSLDFILDEIDSILKKREMSYAVNLLMNNNTISDNGRNIDLSDWTDLFKGSAILDVPDAPAVMVALAGRNVNVEISENDFSFNRGGAFLGALNVDLNLDVNVSGNGGRDNGGIFERNDPGLDWDDYFEGMTEVTDYSFLICGEYGGTLNSAWQANAFTQSRELAMFLETMD